MGLLLGVALGATSEVADGIHVGTTVQVTRRNKYNLPESYRHTTTTKDSDGPHTLCVDWVAVGVIRTDKRSILCSEISTATWSGDENIMLHDTLST